MSVKLRDKFAIPVNLVLVVLLAASLFWEWRRQEATEMGLLRVRLDEEASFILAARRSFGASSGLQPFLHQFCHAVDASASPEHQVALLDPAGNITAAAATHAQRPRDPRPLARQGREFLTQGAGREELLVRVAREDGWTVVVAESTRAAKARVVTNLWSQAGWYLGAAALVLGAANVVMRVTVLRPVKNLSRAVKRLQDGHLGFEITQTSGDELGVLATQFNAMSRALAAHEEETRRELEAAQRVQSQMLPAPVVSIGGMEVAGRCSQRGKVGGDIYDVQGLPGRRVGLFVADLSGHDVAAALHTAMFRAILWQEAERASSPAEALNGVNRRLCRELPEEHFATAFFGWFSAETAVFEYASAGHPTAFLHPARDQRVRELDTTGPLLGLIPDAAYVTGSIEVESGVLLTVYTDGLVEACDGNGSQWGDSRLRDSLATLCSRDPSQIVDHVLERQRAFRDGQSQKDDTTLVVCRFESLDPQARGPVKVAVPPPAS